MNRLLRWFDRRDEPLDRAIAKNEKATATLIESVTDLEKTVNEYLDRADVTGPHRRRQSDRQMALLRSTRRHS